MPLPDLDAILMQRLVASEAWREYAAYLIAQYAETSAALDVTKDDHRFLQGMKLARQFAIETPYVLAGVPSPLTMPSRVERVRLPKPPEEEAPGPPARQFHRPSHLA